MNPLKALKFYLNKFTEDAKKKYTSSLYTDKDTIKLRQNVVQSLNKFYKTSNKITCESVPVDKTSPHLY